MNPYSYPHACERESLARKLAQLNKSQRETLRSYVQRVEFGTMSLADWFACEWGVSESVWRKPWRKGGNYYGTEEDGNPAFRAALGLYVEAMVEWQQGEEMRAVQRAARMYRMAAPDAATVHIELMNTAKDERVRLNAASEVADRASELTASKQATQIGLGPDLKNMIERIYGNSRRTADADGVGSGDASGSAG